MVQRHAHVPLLRALVEAVGALGIEPRGAPFATVDLVTLLPQKFRRGGTVLAGEPVISARLLNSSPLRIRSRDLALRGSD